MIIKARPGRDCVSCLVSLSLNSRQFAFRAILFEASVPLRYLLLGELGVSHQEIQVSLPYERDYYFYRGDGGGGRYGNKEKVF